MAIIVTYDGVQDSRDLITYSDIPNILKIKDTGAGRRTTLSLRFVNDLNAVTSADSQWWITVFGETITNVIDPKNAVSKNFYVAPYNGNNNSTAASVCRALRNCSTIAANFNVLNYGDYVNLEAKAIGPIPTDYNTNIQVGALGYIAFEGHEGSAESRLYGSKVDVEIYAGVDASLSNYVTTLEKNYYGDNVSFNLSPVLNSISKIGEAQPYIFKMSTISQTGDWALLGESNINYTTVGYMVNQGYKYNLATSNTVIAQNMSRGENKDTYNRSTLYIYEPTLPISFYTKDSTIKSFLIQYLDSSYNVITATTLGITTQGTENLLNDAEFQLNVNDLRRAFYVDLTFSDTGNKVRYNVIKPLKMTEYCQRIYFRNSYGGVSFFDFTGQKSETRDLEVATYQKNIFDYYTDPMNELEKVYDNEVKYTVTLKSHLIEKDGKYIFNDMLQSPELWVIRNSEKYAIILDSISVDETTNNDIYEATVKYHYSQEPSLI